VIDLLASIEGSALAVWTRESTSIWAYPTILTLHTFGLAIVVGANAVIDFRLLGMGKRIPVAALRPLFPIMWWAFALNFVTGILLFMSDATTKSGQKVFYVKLTMIALAFIVTRSVWKVLRRDSIETSTPTNLRNRAMLSLVLWTAAIISGRLLAYL
jgi:hypothetical protein